MEMKLTLVPFAIAMTLVALVASSPDYCQPGLCKGGKKHIGCKNSGAFGKACPPDTKVVDLQKHVELILSKHNEKRDKLAAGRYEGYPVPSKMATMSWSNELAELAKYYVIQCVPNVDNCHNTENFKQSGQNIAFYNLTGIGFIKKKTNLVLIKQSLDNWWNEIENATFSGLSKFPKRQNEAKVIRNFAVMARDNNTHVGCAAIRFVIRESHSFIFTCNYAVDIAPESPVYEFRTQGCKSGLTMCYQRQSANNNNHNTLNMKPTHLPQMFYSHGHKWNEPYFDMLMPRNITSPVGKSVYLGCRVKHLGNKTVSWIRHRDLHILTVGTYTYTTDLRFQTSYHRDIDEWTLQIKWAQQRDAGVYECQISTQPVRSFAVHLNIVDNIDIEANNIMKQYYNDDSFYMSSNRIYQSSDDEFAGMFGSTQTVAVPTATILGGPDLYVDKGSTINLTCIIKFSPEPPTHIFWYHQHKVLSSFSNRHKFNPMKLAQSKSILLIENADVLDSGKYSCKPSNTEIASIRVHVLQGERPEAMQTNGSAAASTAPTFKTVVALVILMAILHLLQYDFKFGWNKVECAKESQSQIQNSKPVTLSIGILAQSQEICSTQFEEQMVSYFAQRRSHEGRQFCSTQLSIC